MIHNARKRREVQMEPAMPRVAQVRIPTAKSVRILKVLFFKTGRGHSHEDHVADRGFHSWHHWYLVHTLVPIKVMNIPSVESATGGQQNLQFTNSGKSCKNCPREIRQKLKVNET